MSEPIDPELVLPAPVPIDEPDEVPLVPAELLPLVLWPVLPVVPPLVEPVWANATPVPSIEITANRNHVFRMYKRSR